MARVYYMQLRNWKFITVLVVVYVVGYHCLLQGFGNSKCLMFSFYVVSIFNFYPKIIFMLM